MYNSMPRRRNTINDEEPQQINFETINLNPTPKFDLKNFIFCSFFDCKTTIF